MNFSIPSDSEKLGKERLEFLEAFKRNCKRTILEMLRTSQSGHPGGSLSCLDFLAVLYAFRISHTQEKIIVSNGHISPGVYAVLAEMGVVDKEEVIKTYRQFNSNFEGHVTRHVPGIYYGTGPLGIGVSVASGLAWAGKKNKETAKVFGVMGDGEMQEGQVHEMALWAAKEKLDNLVLFVDYNRVQLTDSLEKTLPIDVVEFFKSKNWKVIEIDGHNDEQIWEAIHGSCKKGRPLAIIGKTIMGKGIPGMEEDGEKLSSTWHGKAPKPEQIDEMLGKKELLVTEEELKVLEDFRKERKFIPLKPSFVENLKPMNLDTGDPILYGLDEITDCRSAYGKALLDLAKRNKNIVASTADLGGSVMTKFVAAELPDQFIEFGIAEQNMVSVSGGLSLLDIVPFCSTFGAFMTSRGRDQARVNDINRTNVKMVSTHCGLSVGEDGPTHQAIDDMVSMSALLNTNVIEPADPNHCDRIIRYVASHYGNFYVRMGRAKLPALTKEDGSVFFDENYTYKYGQTDILRSGSEITILASGACVHEALKARDKAKNPNKIEIIIVSSNKKFDQTLEDSIRRTKKVVTVEDHGVYGGLGMSVANFCVEKGIELQKFKSLGVREYQLSGKPAELYRAARIDSESILKELN
ncbi:transketolase [Candidatus Gracilibacteria bacterium]|nr:transketolase [Candidatus Gracilibacteria bacterium]